MSHLELWEKVRKVPKEATKPITGGRLNGKTDINPVWRLKTLTEQFGVCGIGWKYAITDKRLEKSATDEIKAFVDIDLFIKVDGQWSEAIPGTGGSSFVEKESKGLYTSDECFKMALTDAISVACKALGIGADVYWDKDTSKYDKRDEDAPKQAPAAPKQAAKTSDSKDGVITEKQRLELVKQVQTVEDKARLEEILHRYGYQHSKQIKAAHYNLICQQYTDYNLPEVLQ